MNFTIILYESVGIGTVWNEICINNRRVVFESSLAK